jgi:hypothetical protein
LAGRWLLARSVTAAIAAAAIVCVSLPSTPASAATVRSDRHSLSARTPFSGDRPVRLSPSAEFPLIPSTASTYPLCDFHHHSWCAGTTANAHGTHVVVRIEIGAALITIIQAVIYTIKGIIYIRNIFRGYKGKHRKTDLIGDCLTQASRNVVWGKCGAGTTGAMATSSLWQEQIGSNNALGFVNDYWLIKGQSLWLTAPQPIKANGHLRLHALFGGAGGQTLQEWKKEAA